MYFGCSLRLLTRLSQEQQETLAGTLVASLKEGGALHKSARKLVLILASLPGISPQLLLSLIEAPPQDPQVRFQPRVSSKRQNSHWLGWKKYSWTSILPYSPTIEWKILCSGYNSFKTSIGT